MLEIGVGTDGLKRHIESFRADFEDLQVVRINPEPEPEREVVTLPLCAREALRLIQQAE